MPRRTPHSGDGACNLRCCVGVCMMPERRAPSWFSVALSRSRAAIAIWSAPACDCSSCGQNGRRREPLAIAAAAGYESHDCGRAIGAVMREIVIFGGSAHPELALEICRHLQVPLLPCKRERFANDCLGVQLQANCRERDVFLIQPLVPPVQEHLFELFLMLDAARGASARRITAVIPHYAYARSDKKDAPRISIGGRMVADLLVTAGANRVLTMTLHSPQVHGFFSIPVDHLHALRELAQHF